MLLFLLLLLSLVVALGIPHLQVNPGQHLVPVAPQQADPPCWCCCSGQSLLKEAAAAKHEHPCLAHHGCGHLAGCHHGVTAFLTLGLAVRHPVSHHSAESACHTV
jgi:hypothetical protein